ncbi:MAG: dihydroorotase [Clostridiales bacterium]|jgi:dihydroorotase|nr:dihydroorotase [Clostridiales bacterium]
MLKIKDGLWYMPGLVDLHVHFREPGQTHKEDLASGAAAAVRGGFTTVCAMPNTLPPVDSVDWVKFTLENSAKIGLAEILPIAAITEGMKGLILTDLEGMAAAGAVGFSEDGLSVRNAALKLEAMRLAAALELPIFSHCEDMDLPGIHPASEEVLVARDIILAEHSGARLHICHISTALSVQLVREAKARGVRVTAEVSPHHFTLCADDIPNHDPNFKMNPPLRTKADIAAIKAGLADGTIDAIATDHAPHHADEKAKGFADAPFGIIGLETALSLAFELVDEGVLTPQQLVEKMSLNPKRILGITRNEDFTIFDPNAEWVVNSTEFASKAQNTPFEGRKMRGRVVRTIIGGRIVYDN